MRARSREDANQAKDEFLSVVTHELKTPLTATLGWLRVLRTKQDRRRPQRALATIERGVRHQAQLIDDLLDVSRMVSGRLRIDRQRGGIRRTIETVADPMRPQADAKGVRLDVQAAPLGRAVVGDPDRLQQVVANLVSNAVKFTPANGSIALRLAAVDRRAELVVADTGAGICRSSCRTCSNVSGRRRGSRAARRAASGSGWRSRDTWSSCTAASITVGSDGSGRGRDVRRAAAAGGRRRRRRSPTARRSRFSTGVGSYRATRARGGGFSWGTLGRRGRRRSARHAVGAGSRARAMA